MTFTISTPQRPLTGDERAYLEYSLFSALRPFTLALDVVHVDISVPPPGPAPPRIACAVRIDSPAGPIVARGTGDRLVGAVDAAALRLAEAADARLGTPGRASAGTFQDEDMISH